jgi:hypothetical protein
MAENSTVDIEYVHRVRKPKKIFFADAHGNQNRASALAATFFFLCRLNFHRTLDMQFNGIFLLDACFSAGNSLLLRLESTRTA